MKHESSEEFESSSEIDTEEFEGNYYEGGSTSSSVNFEEAEPIVYDIDSEE